MLRRLTATALAMFVQFGAIAAPLTHVHLDVEKTGHHHGQALHAHLSGHEAAPLPIHGPAADHQESAGRTIATHIFVSPAAEPFSLPAVSSPAFVLVVPAAQPTGRTPHVAHAHDPPVAVPRSPRAPPAALS